MANGLTLSKCAGHVLWNGSGQLRTDKQLYSLNRAHLQALCLGLYAAESMGITHLTFNVPFEDLLQQARTSSL